MTEAIFGLIGVLVGGLLNGGITMLNERRRDQGDAKVGARLVISELRVNEAALETALEGGGLGQISRGSVAEWKNQPAILAAALTNEEWTVVESYCAMFEHLILVSERNPRAPMIPHIEESIRMGIKDKRAQVMEALARCAGTS